MCMDADCLAGFRNRRHMICQSLQGSTDVDEEKAAVPTPIKIK